MRGRKIERAQWALALLVGVALAPAAILAYLQYRSLRQVEDQTRQAFLGNLKQALVGVRVESENDFSQWLRTSLSGPEYHDWLAQRDLRRIPIFLRLGRLGLSRIRQNLFWALAYNAVLIPAALMGYVHPILAATAMMASSLSVILNSGRKLKLEGPRRDLEAS